MGLRELIWQMDRLSWTQFTSIVLFFTLFLLTPLGAVTLKAFTYGGRPSLHWFRFVLSDNFYLPVDISNKPPYIKLSGASLDFYRSIEYTTPAGEKVKIVYVQGWDLGVIPNSLIVAGLTAILSTALGSVLAFLFARYRFPGCEALRILLLVPLLSTPFVGAIGLKKMITADGVLNTLFHDILGILPFKVEFTGLAAVVAVQTLIFYPIVLLNTYTALISIDPTLEEQAENMGAYGFRLFRTVTMPLATPGMEAGALMVFILSLEDLGTPIVFRGTRAEKLLTFQIFTRMFTPAGLISQEATTLALMLLAFSVVVFLGVRKYVSLKRYAMLSRGGVWRPRRRSIRAAAAALIYVCCLTMLFFATLPHAGVALLAFAGEWGGTLLPAYFTLRNFRATLGDPEVMNTIVNSLSYSAMATALIVILGVSAAYLVSRKRGVWMMLVDVLVTVPIAIPGIVIATGLFLVYLMTPLSPLKSGAPLLIAAYTVRKITFTVRSVYSGLEQTDVALEEAALNLGASRARVFFTIAAPLVALNILAGGMLSFIYCMSEVSTGIVIGDANHKTAPMTWKMYDMLFKGLAGGVFQPAALGFMLMMLQLAMIVGANLILRRRATALIGI